MKKKISFAIPVLALIAAAFFASCSDGEMQPQVTTSKDFSSSPPQPVVIVFAADPATVKAGESTTISWEVAGADSVKIAAVSTGEEPLAFSVDSTELKGSQTAENLTATTDFVLTATKAVAVPAEGEGEAKSMKAQAEETAPAPAESPSEVTVTQTITVTVTPASGISISASADDESISPGGSTILHWEVVPADATVTVKDDSDTDVTPTFTGDDCSITDPAELLDSGTPTEATPSSGCAAIDPQATTTYTVSATLAGTGETQTSEVTVSVESEELSAAISVNQSAEATVTNPTEAVEVSWLVSPPTALVTITAEPEVVSCTNPLPAGEAVDYTSTECTLSALPTTFHIEAAQSGIENLAMASATVSLATLGGGEGPSVEVSASSDWAFEGEEVSVSVVASPAVASSIKEVNITDKSGTPKKVEGAPTGPVKVIVPADGVKVSVVGLDGSERTYTAVPALSTHASPINNAQAVTATAIDPTNPARHFVGLMMPGYNGGKVRIIADGANSRDIPFEDLIKPKFAKLGPISADNMENLIKTFPVNTIAVRPGKPEEVYVGTTGGIFLDDFSKAGTPEEFSLVMAAYLVSSSDYGNGEHPTCRNKAQTGRQDSRPDHLIGFKQICDIVIGDDNKMVVAHDYGISVIEDLDKFRAKEIRPIKVGSMYAKVVDDLECIDSGCNTVFAATSAGVFKSVDGGKNWEDFGSFGKKAFAVVSSSDKVFVGAEDGVYVSDVSSGAWTQAGLAGQTTLSLAADPNPGSSGATVIAGTSAGAFVTRDSGASWSAIEVAGGGEVLSVAIGSSEPVNDNRQVSVAIAAGTSFVYGEKPLSLYVKIPTLQAIATQ